MADKSRSTRHSPPSKGGVPAAGGGGGLHNLPELKTIRKTLRHRLTPAEATLWNLLKKKQLEGRKFRRQHSIDRYIIDFYCPAEKLAIELDGGTHNHIDQAKRDRERDIFLKNHGIMVLRIENRIVFDNPDGLLAWIKRHFGWNQKPPRPWGTPPWKGGESFLRLIIVDLDSPTKALCIT
jgi:very-short-patch-repair endonuclease